MENNEIMQPIIKQNMDSYEFLIISLEYGGNVQVHSSLESIKIKRYEVPNEEKHLLKIVEEYCEKGWEVHNTQTLYAVHTRYYYFLRKKKN